MANVSYVRELYRVGEPGGEASCWKCPVQVVEEAFRGHVPTFHGEAPPDFPPNSGTQPSLAAYREPVHTVVKVEPGEVANSRLFDKGPGFYEFRSLTPTHANVQLIRCTREHRHHEP